ncbi:MAG: hypothetical protein NVS3B12_17890 [Acidimicrobiales bacterium]
MSLPPERRRQLQQLGLRALVKRRFGEEVVASARPLQPGGGAGLLAEGPGGTLVAVFADTPKGLASAIDVAVRKGACQLFFFAELNTTAVARRAGEFGLEVHVVDPDGDFEILSRDIVSPVDPLPGDLVPFAERFRAAALDPVWEHGVLTGEWLGLEVARATMDDDGRVTYDVGVGTHDREGNRLLYPDGPTADLLAHAVATVASLRRAGLGPHPANLLVPERWLRTVLIAHPDLVGLCALDPAEPADKREDLRQRGVAPAWGIDRDGRPTVVVCSVGVDPDLVPQAADARLHSSRWPGAPTGASSDWRLVLAVPDGDDHPLTRRAAALLRHPAEVVTIPATWRTLPPTK